MSPSEEYVPVERRPLPEYHWCQVAFIDVLGWKNLVVQSVSDMELRGKMAAALRAAPEGVLYPTVPGGRPAQATGFPRCSQFSDSIVISYSMDAAELWNDASFYHWIWRCCFIMGKNGLFVRGGIATGPMHHENDLAFGPALTAAYEIEQQARVPRILMPDAIVPQFLDKNGMQQRMPGYIRQRWPDNQPFFDFLRYDEAFAPDRKMETLRRHLEQDWRPGIEGALREFAAKNNNDILGKYIWLGEYYNEVAEEVGTPLIEVRGIVGDATRWRRARETPFEQKKR